MKNALTVRSLTARRRLYAERRQARDEARASGIRFDLLVQLMLAPAPKMGGVR